VPVPLLHLRPGRRRQRALRPRRPQAADAAAPHRLLRRAPRSRQLRRARRPSWWGVRLWKPNPPS
jgi:hypothetical protein